MTITIISPDYSSTVKSSLHTHNDQKPGWQCSWIWNWEKLSQKGICEYHLLQCNARSLRSCAKHAKCIDMCLLSGPNMNYGISRISQWTFLNQQLHTSRATKESTQTILVFTTCTHNHMVISNFKRNQPFVGRLGSKQKMQQLIRPINSTMWTKKNGIYFQRP